MKNVKKLSAAALLTLVFSLSAFAGETQTPPCALPEPGETQTPPCSAAPSDMGAPTATSSAAGDMSKATIASSEPSLSEVAARVLFEALPLF